ncbi:MAG: gliding motility-associated C-terminal domain-containing protein [Bacteroidota bacterium]
MKILRCILLCCLGVLPMSHLTAQGEANHWLFGAQGALDFAGGNPTPYYTNPIASFSQKNFASISDACGNLLFFTQGREIWNANMQIMANGFLNAADMGPNTFIAPQPGNPDIYYLFVSGNNVGIGPNYSIIDMSLQGGLGQVTIKRQPFHPNFSAEMAGILHANEVDYWISFIDYTSDTLFSYLLDSSGLQPPVKSYCGILGASASGTGNQRGKFSLDGSKYASPNLVPGTINILDFDPATGLFSNLQTVILNTSHPYPASVEFSPSGRYLYWNPAYIGLGAPDSSVYRLDLALGTTAAIQNSNQLVVNRHAQELQLANNGKIYVTHGGIVPGTTTNWRYIDVINYPDSSIPNIGYVPQVLDLNPGFSQEHFVSFMTNFLRPWRVSIGPSDSLNNTSFCPGDSVPFGLSYYNNIDSIWWDFGDASSINDLAPQHAYTASGSFAVSAIVYRGCPDPDTLRDTILVRPQPMADLGNDTSLCLGQNLPLQHEATAGISYLWSDSTAAPTLLADSSGWYWLEAANACAVERDSVFLSVDQPFSLDIGPGENLLCFGSSTLLDPNLPMGSNASIIWQDSSNNPTFMVLNPGLYWVEATNGCGTQRDSMNVSYELPPTVSLGNDTTLCTGSQLLLDASYVSVDTTAYLWQDQSVNDSFLVNGPGLYWAEVSNLCGTDRDSVQISYLDAPLLDLGTDQLACTGDSVLLQSSLNQPPGTAFLWQDNLADSVRFVDQSGFFVLTASNFCGSDVDSVSVDILPRPMVELGNDTTLCDAATLLIGGSTLPNQSYLWQDGSSNADFLVSQTGLYWLEFSNPACAIRDSILISYAQSPALELGPNDSLLCDGASWLAGANLPDVSYTWQDGSSQPDFLIQQVGLYHLTVSNVCGSASDSIHARTMLRPAIELGTDSLICEGDAIMLNATLPPDLYGDIRYQWQDGSESPIFLADAASVYTVNLENECGTDSDSRSFSLEALPIADLGMDTTFCAGTQLELDASRNQVSRNLRYQWQDGSSQPTYEVSESGLYRVEVFNDCGIASDSVQITVNDCECFVYVPSAFTPNQDGRNDQFTLGHDCQFSSYQLRIFNRWGKEVFQTNDPSQHWDGSHDGLPQAEGVYTFVLRYGYPGRGGEQLGVKQGTATLWR